MRKLAMLFFCLTVSFLSVFGQNRVIKGTVLDAEGKPVSGASVFAKGAKSGVITGKDGSFTLQVAESVKAVEITSLGFEKKEIIIGANGIVNISLDKKYDPLDEVIVTGYQVKKKRDDAGAISSVRGKDIENLPNLSVDKALQGKAAGVLVQSNNGIPGGAINVRIRGQGSYLAGNDPLYIVDGVQFNLRLDGNYTQNNPLAFLNPDDVESIDILKDAATASIYGSNASNGVVLITTKKGKAGKTKFNVNINNGISQPLKLFQMVNAQDYFRLRAEGYGNANNLPWDNLAVLQTVLNELRVPIGSITTVDQAKAAAAALTTYDWQRAAFKNGTLGTYEVSA